MKSNDLPVVLLIFLMFSIACKDTTRTAYEDWNNYGGTKEMIRYSTLTEVDTANVTQLQVAWTYNTGDADTVNHSQIQCNPIIVDGVLYGTSPQMKLFAIDAGTGKEIWVFNPFDSLAGSRRSFFIMNNSRGIAYWTDGKEDKRLYYTSGLFILCINAADGTPVTSFGDSGRVDLHEGLGCAGVRGGAPGRGRRRSH